MEPTEENPMAQTLLECCQWSLHIEKNLKGVIAELRRMHFLDEERETNENQYQFVSNERSHLLTQLSNSSATEINTVTMILTFGHNIELSWKNATEWICYEMQDQKVKCLHVEPVGGSLLEYAGTMKKALQNKLRILDRLRYKETNWHPLCMQNFSTVHSMIATKLSQLLQCDNILHNIIFFKEATPFLANQNKEIETFIKDYLSGPLSVCQTDKNSFLHLSNLLTEERNNQDSLPTFPRPIPYRDFKNIPLPPPLFLEYNLTSDKPVNSPCTLTSENALKQKGHSLPSAPERKVTVQQPVKEQPTTVHSGAQMNFMSLPKGHSGTLSLPAVPTGTRPNLDIPRPTSPAAQMKFMPLPQNFSSPHPIIGFQEGFRGLHQKNIALPCMSPRIIGVANVCPRIPPPPTIRFKPSPLAAQGPAYRLLNDHTKTARPFHSPGVKLTSKRIKEDWERYARMNHAMRARFQQRAVRTQQVFGVSPNTPLRPTHEPPVDRTVTVQKRT